MIDTINDLRSAIGNENSSMNVLETMTIIIELSKAPLFFTLLFKYV